MLKYSSPIFVKWSVHMKASGKYQWNIDTV